MFLPTLLALATGVYPGPRFSSMPRVVVFVKHAGPVREFQLSVRTKDAKSDEWQYFTELKHLPMRLRTSSKGRRVVLTLPKELKRWTQVCAFLPAEERPGEQFRVQFSLESCSNLPNHRPF